MQKCVTRYELQDFVVMSLVDCSEPTIAGEHLVVARWCVMAKEGIAEEGIVFAQGGSDGHGTPLVIGRLRRCCNASSPP